MTNEKIRLALKKRGMKQWELAEKIGVSEPTITRWLRKELPKNVQDQLLMIINGQDIPFDYDNIIQRYSSRKVDGIKTIPIATYVDRELLDRIDTSIEGTMISRAEFTRKALEHYLDWVVR